MRKCGAFVLAAFRFSAPLAIRRPVWFSIPHALPHGCSSSAMRRGRCCAPQRARFSFSPRGHTGVVCWYPEHFTRVLSCSPFTSSSALPRLRPRIAQLERSAYGEGRFSHRHYTVTKQTLVPRPQTGTRAKVCTSLTHCHQGSRSKAHGPRTTPPPATRPKFLSPRAARSQHPAGWGALPCTTRDRSRDLL